jgi:hypothetical protein
MTESTNEAFEKEPSLNDTLEESGMPLGRPPAKGSTFGALILFAVLVLLGIIAAGIYLFLQGQSRKEEPTTLPETGEEESGELGDVEEIENIYEGWKTYENSEFEIYLNYPSDWVLDEAVAEESESCSSLALTVAKEGYVFQLEVPCTLSSSICIFDDTDTASVPSGSSTIEFGEYEEFGGDNVDLRRGYSGDFVQYYVCKLNTESMLFDTFVDPAFIQYQVPAGTVNEDVLKTLDYILQSML